MTSEASPPDAGERLVPCKECGRHAAASAATCPHCGAPVAAGPRAVRFEPGRDVQVMYGPPPFTGRRGFLWFALAAGATAAGAWAYWKKWRGGRDLTPQPEYGPPRAPENGPEPPEKK